MFLAVESDVIIMKGEKKEERREKKKNKKKKKRERGKGGEGSEGAGGVGVGRWGGGKRRAATGVDPYCYHIKSYLLRGFLFYFEGGGGRG